MPSFTPEFLATAAAGTWTRPPSAPVTAFSTDSRVLGEGAMFVALGTDKRDGHDFVGAAAQAGASAALVARELPGIDLAQLVVADPLRAFQAIAAEHRSRFHGTVVGVTGSAGKTSTKDLLALLLGGAEDGVVSTRGNLNNHLGVPLTLTRLDPERDRAAVIEAGISEPGEMAMLASMIAPDHVIVTLVDHAHTQELGGLEGVAIEKARLGARLSSPEGRVVFPLSCWVHEAFRQLGPAALVAMPAGSPRPAADHVVFDVRQAPSRTELVVDDHTYHLRRVTLGQAQNAALALIVARRLGCGTAALQAGLDAWRPGTLRGEWREQGGRRLYLDCYNANPASMIDALEYFGSVTAGSGRPRLFLLGGMEELGDDAEAHHRALGRRLQLLPGDRLILVGDLASATLAGALEAGVPAEWVELMQDAEAAAPRVEVFHGDVFLKGSRRHRLERAVSFLPVSDEFPRASAAA